MQRQLELLMTSNQFRPSFFKTRILLPVLAAAVALAIQAGLNSMLQGPYFFLFFPTSIIVAWIADFKAAMITIILCIAGADYFLLEPHFTFTVNNIGPALALAFVGFSSVFSTWAFSKMRIQNQYAQSAQQELNTILRSIGDAVIVTDLSQTIVFINPMAEKLTGWMLEEARGMKLSKVFPIFNQHTRQQAPNPMDRVLSEGGVVGLANHTILISKDGCERRIEDSAAPISITAGGKILGAVLAFRDVTEKRASEQRFAALFNSAPQATALAKMPDGVIVDVNPSFEQLLGYSREEVIGKSSKELNLYVQNDKRQSIYNEILETGILQNMEFDLRAKSGKIVTAAVSVRTINLDGTLHTLASLLDMTKIREAERVLREQEEVELRQSEKRFRELVNSLPQLAWTSDPNGNHYWYNDRWYTYTGTTIEQVQGLDWKRVHHPEFLDKVTNWWDSARAAGLPSEFEYPLRAADGSYRWFLTRIVPIKDNEGRVIKWCGTNTDIQEQKLYETNLAKSIEEAEQAKEDAERARREAERANELKSTFLANMSHEIRTPLGAMMGFADLLRDPGISERERSNYADILVRNGENLSVIINDILDLSKVEAGHLILEFTEVSPHMLADEVVALLLVKAKEKNLSLTYTCEASTPLAVISDPVRFKQILLNIVGNAIKFTTVGSVNIRSYGRKTKNGLDAVYFEVSDTGVGIPEEYRQKLFEMFVQGDGSMTRRFGGTGLGLALSKRLAIALGGNVELTKSMPGNGSTFSIAIESQPRRKSETIASTKRTLDLTKAQKNETLDGVRILVVDDSIDNRQLIESYLKKYGASVRTAENGVVGYKQALADNFDAVLMDIQMPEMDGYSATQKLRLAGYKKPIIALTAHAMTDVRQKCISVGCSGHLSKPINIRELIDVIAQVTGHSI